MPAFSIRICCAMALLELDGGDLRARRWCAKNPGPMLLALTG
jgi:hypothetical protein